MFSAKPTSSCTADDFYYQEYLYNNCSIPQTIPRSPQIDDFQHLTPENHEFFSKNRISQAEFKSDVMMISASV